MNRAHRGSKAAVRHFETLESRIAMAADVTAALLPNGTLAIEGTTRNDTVDIAMGNGNLMAWVYSSGRQIAMVPASNVHAIKASMGAGNDILRVYLGGVSLSALSIDMGAGHREKLYVKEGTTDTLTIDTTKSMAAYVWCDKMAVTNEAFARFGKGNDTMSIQECTVNRLNVNMGAGNDTLGVLFTKASSVNADMGAGNDILAVEYTKVSSVNVKMGAGNDIFGCSTESTILNGTVDGGSGYDTFEGRLRKGRVKGFEVIS